MIAPLSIFSSCIHENLVDLLKMIDHPDSQDRNHQMKMHIISNKEYVH